MPVSGSIAVTALTMLGFSPSAGSMMVAARVAMSTSGSASAASAARIASGSMVGRSPWTLMMASKSPSGSSPATASWIRSEPEGWSGRVSTARPPALLTASTIASSAQATSTGPIEASIARRQTWTIIGSP